MCGRFTLIAEPQDIIGLIAGIEIEHWSGPRYNIVPTQPIATVLNTEERSLTYAHWGLIPSWSKDRSLGSRLINARAETIAEKPSFRGPFRRQRCLILADGFYEWMVVPGRKRKTPVYIRMKSNQPFVFAGLWDRWHGPDGEKITSTAIITTTPNELIAPVHNRMPVILTPESSELWISPEQQPPDLLLSLLKPYPASDMKAFEVSAMVNNPSFDDPKCIEPATDPML